jgi:hypothetical protein
MGHAALCPLMLRTYSRVIAVTAMARLTPGTGAFLVSNFHPPVGGPCRRTASAVCPVSLQIIFGSHTAIGAEVAAHGVHDRHGAAKCARRSTNHDRCHALRCRWRAAAA